jgi:hypothetical protein
LEDGRLTAVVDDDDEEEDGRGREDNFIEEVTIEEEIEQGETRAQDDKRAFLRWSLLCFVAERK